MTSQDTATFDYTTLLQFALDKTRCAHAPSVAEQMTIAQLGFDSLELMELQMELEDIHGLKLEVDTIGADTVFGDLIASLKPLDA
jgi:acyl carrier protein